MQEEKMLKDGNLNIKSGLRKKEYYCVLYGRREDNPAYLACYDNKESYKKDKNKSKCQFHLDNIKGIDKIIKGTKNEYHIDICTKKEKILLAADSEENIENWYKYIHAIQKGKEHEFAPSDGSFKTNVLYDSSEDTVTFDVKIRPTELSKNHFLKDHYKLHITAGGLSLEDPSSYKMMFHWPYEFIRKFGKKKDVFALSAGRRCESGEGELEFELDEPERITAAIDLKTDKKVEARKVSSEIRSSYKESGESNSPVLKRTSEPVRELESKHLSRDVGKIKTLPRDVQSNMENLSFDAGTNISRAIDQNENFKKTDRNLSGDNSQTTIQKSEKENKEKENKENKKWGGFFGKKSKKSSKTDKTKDKATNQNEVSVDSEPPEVLYDEASDQQKQRKPVLLPPTGPVYDDAITLNKNGSFSSSNQTFYDSSPVPVESMYAEAGNRSEAWKQYAASGDYHVEFYEKVRDAASEIEYGKKIEIEKDYEDDDETYDRLTLSSVAKNKRQYHHSDEIPGHIYGIAGGKAVEDVEDDYTFAEADQYQYDDINHSDSQPKKKDGDDDLYDDTALVEYDDAASTQNVLIKSERRLNAYEDVDLDGDNSKA